jgi:Na+:H+ antiporter, NhaB family
VVFTAILFSTRSKIGLSLLFCVAGALLSAFLDALTVTAVIIAVCKGFWDVYNNLRSRSGDHDEAELEQFRAFLRSLVMHAVIGTALGGVMTMVGEPQNLLIAHVMQENLPADRDAHWSFLGFITTMAVVTVPTLVVGLITCVLVERFRILGYGVDIPERVRTALRTEADEARGHRTPIDRTRLRLMGACAALLVLGLAFHWAEVGILGLFLIVLVTAFTGVNDEHRIGHAFTESLPFTSLLVVFFAIVAMIGEQGLFRPVIALALAQPPDGQRIAFFCANALLSAVSDNVFVATVFINEATAAYTAGAIDAQQYEHLAVAINTGTNIPSIATPNGQAALLFLLTSALAAPIRLGYLTMMRMAFPYAVTMTAVSLAAVWLLMRA